MKINIFHVNSAINTLSKLKVNYEDKNCNFFPFNIDGGKIIGKILCGYVRPKQILPDGKRLIGNQKDKPKHSCFLGEKHFDRIFFVIMR